MNAMTTILEGIESQEDFDAVKEELEALLNEKNELFKYFQIWSTFN